MRVEVYTLSDVGIECGLDVWSGRERVVVRREGEATMEWDRGVTAGLHRELFRCT